MSDDFLDRLRQLDGVGYPGRGDRLDPTIVVRAGRHRRTTRRIAAASAACGVVLALGLASSALRWYADRQPAFPIGVPTGRVTSAATEGPAPTVPAPTTGGVPTIPSPLPANGTAPPAAVIVPGILAATGVPTEPFATAGADGKVSDWWFHLATSGQASLVLHVAAGDDGQTFAAYGVRDGQASTLPPGGTEVRFDAAPREGATVLPGHDGMFDAGVTPPGATRAFYVSSGGFATGDGTRRFALELPTFAVPRVAGVPDRSQRMFALAFTQPATDRLLDMTSTLVYTKADGTIIDGSCGADTCTPRSLPDFPDAFAEIQAILSGALSTPCAEFPAMGGTFEGWWNGTPADAETNILRDPAMWPTEPREHPRVALVDTDTAAVLETWDRVACGPDPSFAATARADWPAHSVALVDMSTGETIGILAASNH